MRYDLAALTRRASNPRRATIVFRDIVPPAVLATDLYRSCYAPVIAAWTAQIEPLMAVYERSLAQLTTDSPADAQAELNQAAGAIERLLLLLTPEVRNWALRTERWFRTKWTGAMLAATSVDMSTMLGPTDVRASLETHIEWNTALIRDVSDQTRQRIGNAVFDGLRNRTPARDVAKTIRQSVTMSRDRSLRIASDQLTKLTSSLADERRREAGIDEWKWRHSGKKHPREDHKARDGKVYADDDAPQDRPGRLPYCGCRSQAVLRLD